MACHQLRHPHQQRGYCFLDLEKFFFLERTKRFLTNHILMYRNAATDNKLTVKWLFSGRYCRYLSSCYYEGSSRDATTLHDYDRNKCFHPCKVSRLIRTFLIFDYANRLLVIVASITAFVGR